MAFTPTFPATAHDLAVEIADYADSQIAVVNEAALRFEEDFGAVGDNTTDDTEAFQTAVSTAGAAAISNGSYYTELRMHPKHRYLLSGTPLHGGSTKGNALIPLPVPPETGRNLIFVIKGSEDQAQHWHWNQTIRQDAGAVIRTTLSGTNDATWGPLSVMGGPTPVQGYGAVTNLWSNMTIVIDGVQIINPDNPSICGFDFGGVGRMVFKNGSVVTNAAGVGGHSSPTNGWQFGLRTPQNNNNARSEIGNYTAVAQNYGGYINEHSRVDHIIALYCVAGVEAGDGSGTGHGISIQHLTTEACDVGLGCVTGGFPVKVDIQSMNHETMGFAVISDPSDFLLGSIKVSGIGAGSSYLVDGAPNALGINGARNADIYDMSRQSGIQTAPSIPATTVALRNPFWRNAHIQITGGTVTNIQVTDAGGTAQSWATSTASPVYVTLPTGAYITLTYSAAPSWKWMIT
jgi:hypothetical protein